jgi:hypothetical protein
MFQISLRYKLSESLADRVMSISSTDIRWHPSSFFLFVPISVTKLNKIDLVD